MYRTAVVTGAIFAGTAVILGAFGAHALKGILDATQLVSYETGVRYQFYHSLALLITGIAYAWQPAKMFKWATFSFITGILMFSGSLYLLTFLKISGQVGLKGLGIITPIGGIFFILGWIFLVAGALKRKQA